MHATKESMERIARAVSLFVRHARLDANTLTLFIVSDSPRYTASTFCSSGCCVMAIERAPENTFEQLEEDGARFVMVQEHAAAYVPTVHALISF